MLADRRLCLDRSQSRLVEAGTPDSAWLLAGKGQEIEPEDVKRLGLVQWGDGRVMQGPEPVADPVPVIEPVEVEPLADIVHPAGAMPEPILPPESRRSRKKV